MVWCGVLVGGRGGDGIDFYVCEKYKMMDINLLASSPCSLALPLSPSLAISLSLSLPLTLSFSPSLYSLFLSLDLSVSCLSSFLSPSRPPALVPFPSLSCSLTLHPVSTHSPRVVHGVVTLVYTTARPYASVREIHTYTRVSHERRGPTVQPHLAYRGTGRGGGRGGGGGVG